jgi:hypothetical protein
VPEKQTVFASFPDSHSLKYRAHANTVEASRWQVFCHHGVGYAVDEWPAIVSSGKMLLMRGAVEVGADVGSPVYPSLPVGWPGF